MSYITGVALLSPGDIYTTTATPAFGLQAGQVGYEGSTGKSFRYTLAGGVTLVVGNLLQASAQDTTYENMAVATAVTAAQVTAGQSTLEITNGTATITAEQFYGGTLSIYTAGTIGVGDEYTILGVTGTLTTGGALVVQLDRPLRSAVTTSAKVNMKRSPWSGAIQFPVTTQTEIPVGVAIYPITNAQYGWVQTHGQASALSDNSTYAVGSMLSPSLAVAGAVGVNVAGTTHGTIGWARMAAASAKGIAIFLQID